MASPQRAEGRAAQLLMIFIEAQCIGAKGSPPQGLILIEEDALACLPEQLR
jgi:hypothetical protein